MMPSSAARHPTSPIGGEITQALEDAAERWSAGDLDGFLTSYEDAPTTLLVRTNRILRGLKEIGDSYREIYGAGDRARMGRLSLGELDIRPLGGAHALAIGGFHVMRAAEHGGEVSGFFSLLFQRFAQDWKIVVDHTP